MNIDWKVVSQSEQRYDTSGDWYWNYYPDTIVDYSVLHIRVSHLSDRRYEFCLGVHELVEAVLCWFAGITQKQVDDFDMPFEAAHQRGDPHYPCGCPRIEYSDPGDDIHAPYRLQHRVAQGVEYTIATVLRIDWDQYDAEVEKPPE